MIIGVLSDLRGLAYAFNKESTFQMFFDWVYLFFTKCISFIKNKSYKKVRLQQLRT